MESSKSVTDGVIITTSCIILIATFGTLHDCLQRTTIHCPVGHTAGKRCANTNKPQRSNKLHLERVGHITKQAAILGVQTDMLMLRIEPIGCVGENVKLNQFNVCEYVF